MLPEPQPQPMPLALFDYPLPQSAIAQVPASPRDASRLLLLERDFAPAHHAFLQLPQLLQPGDLLVVNHTQVIPARLIVHKSTGGKVELLFHTPCEMDDGNSSRAQRWKALARPARGLDAGKVLRTASAARLTVVGRDHDSVVVQADGPLLELLHREGTTPLPPYIDGAEQPSQLATDAYQSMFGDTPGAVAAPTASLHFTPRVMQALSDRNIAVARVLLHVGPGTFLPVRPEHAGDVRGHTMHGEWYHIPEATRQSIVATKARGKRVIAVGTTSLRAVETWAQSGAASGTSTLFVTPGYRFCHIDSLLTNFHLPKSTLLMLVSAMAGRQRILDAYAEALTENYRFFSFGDAMLLLDPICR